MIETKILEIRDVGTMIPAIAIRLGSDDTQERKICARAGFGREIETQREYILLGMLAEQGKFYYDPYAWPGRARTMTVAHAALAGLWESLPPGGIVDVRHILGEIDAPATSDCK